MLPCEDTSLRVSFAFEAAVSSKGKKSEKKSTRIVQDSIFSAPLHPFGIRIAPEQRSRPYWRCIERCRGSIGVRCRCIWHARPAMAESGTRGQLRQLGNYRLE